MATIGQRVVVVEDDDGMREAIESLLGAAGFAAASHASAEALLAAGLPANTGCIVSDIRLPGLSGLGLLIALRARGEACPVILVTAHDTPALRDEAARLGAAAYLPKPFAASELLGAIAGATGRRRPSQPSTNEGGSLA